MDIKFNGYRTWKNVKDAIGVFDFYIFPTILIHYHDIFDVENDYPIEIRIAWLVCELSIYLKK